MTVYMSGRHVST